MRLLTTALVALFMIPGLTFAIGADDLLKAAPNLTYGVAQRALDAVQCSIDIEHEIDKLIVVDMSQGANSQRLWAFDLKDPSKTKLILNDRVAHGSGSDRAGTGTASKFSNTPNSHMTSLGLYRIAERYRGKNGFSRRLDGIFSHWNSNARNRAVVMHPSSYVNENRVGRSQGCPAVNQKTMDALEAAGLNNAVLWIDGPEPGLVKEVAECAEKKRKHYEIERRNIELAFLKASNFTIPGFPAAFMKSVLPVSAQVQGDELELVKVEALLGSMRMNFGTTCTGMEWSVDHWTQGTCPGQHTFSFPVLPNSEPALQQLNGQALSDRWLHSRFAAAPWRPRA